MLILVRVMAHSVGLVLALPAVLSTGAAKPAPSPGTLHCFSAIDPGCSYDSQFLFSNKGQRQDKRCNRIINDKTVYPIYPQAWSYLIRLLRNVAQFKRSEER